MTLRFPLHKSVWLLLRLMPAAKFGSYRAWNEKRLDDGQWAPSCAELFGEPYPWRGDYEIDKVLDGEDGCLGPDMAWIEQRIRYHQSEGRLPSIGQRRRNDYAAMEAEDQRVWNIDYENCKDANPAFCGEPMVGYGKKSGARKDNAPTMTAGAYEKVKAIQRARTARARNRRGVNQ